MYLKSFFCRFFEHPRGIRQVIRVQSHLHIELEHIFPIPGIKQFQGLNVLHCFDFAHYFRDHHLKVEQRIEDLVDE